MGLVSDSSPHSRFAAFGAIRNDTPDASRSAPTPTASQSGRLAESDWSDSSARGVPVLVVPVLVAVVCAFTVVTPRSTPTCVDGSVHGLARSGLLGRVAQVSRTYTRRTWWSEALSMTICARDLIGAMCSR